MSPDFQLLVEANKPTQCRDARDTLDEQSFFYGRSLKVFEKIVAYATIYRYPQFSVLFFLFLLFVIHWEKRDDTVVVFGALLTVCLVTGNLLAIGPGLGNLTLLAHPLGRNCLSSSEKLAAQATGALVLAAMIILSAGIVVEQAFWFYLATLILVLLLPFSDWQNETAPRIRGYAKISFWVLLVIGLPFLLVEDLQYILFLGAAGVFYWGLFGILIMRRMYRQPSFNPIFLEQVESE